MPHSRLKEDHGRERAETRETTLNKIRQKQEEHEHEIKTLNELAEKRIARDTYYASKVSVTYYIIGALQFKSKQSSTFHRP